MPKSRHSKKRASRRSVKMIMGGDCGGAAAHGITTYGGIGEQHAGSNGSIAVNSGLNLPTVHHTTGGSPLAPSEYKGGAPLAPSEYKGGSHAPLAPALVSGSSVTPVTIKGGDGEEVPAAIVTDPEVVPAEVADENNMGGGILTDLAIPAALLYTRDAIRKRRLPGLPRFSMKKSRRFNRRRSNRRRR
jgi:hypothetical protein